jgi:hypothetical protein
MKSPVLETFLVGVAFGKGITVLSFNTVNVFGVRLANRIRRRGRIFRAC